MSGPFEEATVRNDARQSTTVPGPAQSSRLSRSIDTAWQFHKGDMEEPGALSGAKADWTVVDVPHCWNTADILDDTPGYYRGVGWYRKDFRIEEPRAEARAYVVFQAANRDATVYLNGARIGEHLGGYTAFALDLTDGIRFGQTNTLHVRLSNAPNDDVPPVAGDLGHYGGLYRGVHILTTNPVHFDLLYFGSSGVFVDTPLVSREKATVRVRARLLNESDQPRSLRVTHDILDSRAVPVAALVEELALEPRGATALDLVSAPIQEPCLWSPEHPHLYRVRSRVVDAITGEVLDQVDSPLGFRWFSIDPDKGFFLNGEPCYIKGVGKHQDYPGRGFAVAEEVLAHDVKLVKEMGANLLRAHYPQASVVYDICDRLGVMGWAKVPIMERVTHSRAFAANTRHMITEMILQNYNHPSVVMWGYECEPLGEMDWFWPKPRDPQAVRENMEKTYEMSATFEESIRATDPTRLTANDFHTNPNPQWYRDAGITGLSDIVGWEIYRGWYNGTLDDVGSMMDETRGFAPDRPYMVAEYGAGSDMRIHTDDPTVFDFSTEYQCRFHETYLAEAATRPWNCGLCIWTLLDFQIESRGDTIPHVNQKGMVCGDRTPKDVYYLYKAHWSDEPVVHIASRGWEKRVMALDEAGTRGAPITVYSNQPRVELFHNGRSAGVADVAACKAVFSVALVEGTNRLDAVAANGLRDSLDIDCMFVPRRLHDLNWGAAPLCINAGQSRTFFYDPYTRTRWLHDQPYREGGFGHVGGRYYRHWPEMPAWDGIREGVGCNIAGTDLDPVFQTFLLGLREYRADVAPGEYEVKLYFAEPFDSAQRRDPADPTGTDAQGCRVFDVAVNGMSLCAGLDLAARYGERRAVTLGCRCTVDGAAGIRVEFTPQTGEPVLNGITLRRVGG